MTQQNTFTLPEHPPLVVPESPDPQTGIPTWVLQTLWQPPEGSVFYTVGELIERDGINELTDMERVDAALLELGVGAEVRGDAIRERDEAYRVMRWAYALTGVIPESTEGITLHTLVQSTTREV